MSKIAYVVSAIPKVLKNTLLNPPTAPILSLTGSAMLFLKLAFVLSVFVC